jgi:hypothetical protein
MLVQVITEMLLDVAKQWKIEEIFLEIRNMKTNKQLDKKELSI